MTLRSMLQSTCSCEIAMTCQEVLPVFSSSSKDGLPYVPVHAMPVCMGQCLDLANPSIIQLSLYADPC